MIAGRSFNGLRCSDSFRLKTHRPHALLVQRLSVTSVLVLPSQSHRIRPPSPLPRQCPYSRAHTEMACAHTEVQWLSGCSGTHVLSLPLPPWHFGATVHIGNIISRLHDSLGVMPTLLSSILSISSPRLHFIHVVRAIADRQPLQLYQRIHGCPSWSPHVSLRLYDIEVTLHVYIYT